jgi:hypothetical protein
MASASKQAACKYLSPCLLAPKLLLVHLDVLTNWPKKCEIWFCVRSSSSRLFLMSNFHISQMWIKYSKEKGWSGVEWRAWREQSSILRYSKMHFWMSSAFTGFLSEFISLSEHLSTKASNPSKQFKAQIWTISSATYIDIFSSIGTSLFHRSCTFLN